MGNQSFSIDLRRYVEKTKNNMEQVARGAIMDIGNRLVERTPVGNRELWLVNIDRATRGLPPVPVGYVGGRARANWQHGVDSPPTNEVDAVDASGETSKEQIRTSVEASPAFAVHYLTNNVPYAVPLEEGHSTQAPNGMVALTCIDFHMIVNEAVAKVSAA